MPRQAHGRPVHLQHSSQPRKRKPARGKGLNALEAAEREFPESIKVKQHRLGEADDDSDEPRTRQDVDGRSAKRRKVEVNTGDVEDDESVQGSDVDGNEFHIGVTAEDDDSDLDSEDAFGGSDEEKFADFTFRGSNTVRPSAKTRSNQDETGSDQEEEASDDESLGEDGIDLAAALDQNEDEEREVRQKMKRKSVQTSDGLDSSEDSIVSDQDEDSDESAQEPAYDGLSASESEIDEETTARLRNFVNKLNPPDQQDVSQASRAKKRVIPDTPSQFGLPSAGLSASDLLQYVKDPVQRQSLKMLRQADREEPSSSKSGISGRLAVPLAKRQQDRLDRVAAYGQTKQDMNKWVDTIKQNRRSEHLSFPQVDPSKSSASAVHNLQPIASTEPQSALESKIQEIMRESGMDNGTNKNQDVEEQAFENLTTKNVPLEEIQARRRELRLQRELLFREEVRAKRIKKIKSKAYRRVHRKERDKFAVQERERLAAAGAINSDEEREQNDRRRAEERMGARHRESRWAKAAKATGQVGWNDDARSGVAEMARRDDELRRRIQGKNVDLSGESSSENEDDEDYASNSEDEVRQLNGRIKNLDTAVTNSRSKLGEMAFMQRAEAVRKAQNDAELRQVKADLNGGDISDHSSQDEAPARQSFSSKPVQQQNKILARPQKNDFEERLSEDEASVVGEQDLTMSETTPTQRIRDTPRSVSITNPARTNGKGPFPGTVKNSEISNTQSARIVGPKTALSAMSKPKKSKPVKGPRETALDDYTSPSDSDHDDGTDTDGLDAKDRLALDIFAGDDEADLRAQFKKEKQKTVQEEDDQIEDNSLPGWGSWTGAGVSKKAQARAKQAQKKFQTIVKGVAPDQRQDAKLDRVIVNEKTVKKNAKYLATDLPHPYESRSQYERALRLPMGPEWSTRSHYQDAIKPRVLAKQGAIIRPIARPIA